MKSVPSAVCATVFGVATVLLLFVGPLEARSTRLLGARECTWGPSYWCSNITNAKNCNAVRHCIQTVWEHKNFPEDNDSICKICLDMVKQARDQLESNETQELIKEVFEGSCALIHIKPVVKECKKIADNFIPELIEALSSQMNPQAVCSVAGLCNNVEIDKQIALAEMTTRTTSTEAPQTHAPIVNTEPVKRGQLSCSGCNTVAKLISDKFKSSSRDDILENMLHACGEFSSFSDACANIVLVYFNDIYEKLEESVEPEAICHMSGVCSAKFHQHPEAVEIRPMSNVGFIPVGADIPCELCEQLVNHLRDVLIANTTEDEFKQVLEGLCKQTRDFEDECLSIVNQYYHAIYHTLVNGLDANGMCFMIGICRKDIKDEMQNKHPIMPLLPSIPVQRIDVSIKAIPKKKVLGVGEPIFTNEQIQAAQLPIDRILGPMNSDQLVQNGQVCTLCEYVLHFVQEALATPKNEKEIEDIVNRACNKMPTMMRGQCHNFIDTYGDEIIALLIQDIDPRTICPKIKLCSKHVQDMEVFAPQPIDVSIVAKSSSAGDKPTCPLCLLAVKQAQEVIKSDKTIDNIKKTLDNLCNHLSNKLKGECVDFVDTYSAELVEMLIKDFTAQEICVYLKLCSDSTPNSTEFNVEISSDREDIMTNEIPDNTVNGHLSSVIDKEYVASPECYLCQEVIKEAEKQIVNKKSREQIKHALDKVCHKIYKRKSCEDFVSKYGDKIIDAILKGLTPKEICRYMELCAVNDIEDLDIDEALTIDVIAIPSNHPVIKLNSKMTGLDDIITPQSTDDYPYCVMCEFAMTKIEQELQNNMTKEEIKKTVKSICRKLPNTIGKDCNKFIDEYADMIIDMLDSMSAKEICKKLQLCPNTLDKVTDEVVECGVCHGAVSEIYPFLKSKTESEIKELEHFDLIGNGCENLPAKYYEMCSELIKYYGVSIMNLINHGTDQAEVCAEIGKCFKAERSSWAYLRLSDGKELKRSRRAAAQELLGAKKCTWGPSYWCEVRSNAEECNAIKYCEEKVWGQSKAKK